MAKKDNKPKYQRRYCADCRWFTGGLAHKPGYCTFERDVCRGTLRVVLHPFTTYECIRFVRRSVNA